MNDLETGSREILRSLLPYECSRRSEPRAFEDPFNCWCALKHELEQSRIKPEIKSEVTANKAYVI